MNIPYNMISGIVIPGDAYVKSRNIDYIDFVKLDVEGVEDRVLNGFTESLKTSKIGMIQFEFGTANIISKFLLIDYYKLLMPLGFVIGKLTGNGLVIKDYNLTDESFGDFHGVAIHKSRQDLINLLQ